MKKCFYLLLIGVLFLPFSVFAKSYTLKDLSISMDDSSWYVFTRYNIINNPKLNELGVSYDYLNNFMTTNDIYLDSLKYNENDKTNMIELFVAIKKVDNVNNLHTYSTREMKEFGEEIKNKFKADNYDIYSSGKYKYIHVKYYDSATSINVDEYYTVMNGYGYSILAQKSTPLSNADEEEVKDIINTISFKYNSEYEKSSSNSILVHALIGGIAGGLVALIGVVISKKKNKKQKNLTDSNM